MTLSLLSRVSFTKWSFLKQFCESSGAFSFCSLLSLYLTIWLKRILHCARPLDLLGSAIVSDSYGSIHLLPGLICFTIFLIISLYKNHNKRCETCPLTQKKMSARKYVSDNWRAFEVRKPVSCRWENKLMKGREYDKDWWLPDSSKLLFRRLPRAAIFTEFKKLYK